MIKTRRRYSTVSGTEVIYLEPGEPSGQVAQGCGTKVGDAVRPRANAPQLGMSEVGSLQPMPLLKLLPRGDPLAQRKAWSAFNWLNSAVANGIA